MRFPNGPRSLRSQLCQGRVASAGESGCAAPLGQEEEAGARGEQAGRLQAGTGQGQALVRQTQLTQKYRENCIRAAEVSTGTLKSFYVSGPRESSRDLPDVFIRYQT